MGKLDRVKKDKTNDLKEELKECKKKFSEMICLLKEKQMEKCELLDENYNLEKELNEVKDKNKELEEKLQLFDDVKRKFDDLEEMSKRLEEENSLQKREILNLKQENDSLKLKPLVSNVSCDTEDLCSSFGESDVVETVCDK